MKQIKLSQGLFSLVDDEDYEELSKHKWYAAKDRHLFYAVRNIGKRPSRKKIRMHRQIMNAQKGQEIDHKKGNGLDNQRSNLRFCTHSQNKQNQCKISGTSRWKGVCWNKALKKWVAQIKLNGHLKHLGYFIEEEEAAKSYDKAARKLFGEFARLNNC